MTEAWQRGGFGLYVHWPFCLAKCPYCDFNSHVARSVDPDAWLTAFRSEIARVAAETEGRVLRSIFFGGGTPSLMEPRVVGGVLRAAEEAWRWANDIEITMEANPTSVEAERFAAYRDAGVNRISMGIQSLVDDDLRRLGRQHSAAEAMAAFSVARRLFPRVSFDLIYARQDQTLEDWAVELDRALSLAVDHLSLYQLTIEDGTAFAARQAMGGLKGLPDEDLAADMFELTQERTAAAGFTAYETSNHARAGAESRHNLIYWMGGDYAGIGPGAHGRITLQGRRWATEAPRGPDDWLRQVGASGSGEEFRGALTPVEDFEERVMMGLRLRAGLDLGSLPLPAERIAAGIARMTDAGMVESDGGQLRLTPRGRPLLNAVLRELLAG